MELVRGFLLKAVPYTESQSIIYLFTKEEGFMAMITSGINNKRKTILPIMQLCEVEFLRNSRGGLHKLSVIAPVNKASNLNFEIERGTYASLWGNLLATFLREQHADEQLFEYLHRAVELLEGCREGFVNVTLLFWIRMAGLFGIRPDCDNYEPGMLFNLESGEFVESRAYTNGMVLTGPNVAQAIYRFSTIEVEMLGRVKIDFKSFEILLETMMHYYERHFAVKFNRTEIGLILEILRT